MQLDLCGLIYELLSNKYRIAEKLDPNWALIGAKIYTVSLLQYTQEKTIGHLKRAQQIKKTVDSYEQKFKKFEESLEVKKYFDS